MASELQPYQEAIQHAKERFEKIGANIINYDRESIFAMQALIKNDFTLTTANKNKQSVQLAMINVASTGLTLNPANGYAYLVPRDGSIVLDISYKGLIKIATDSGSIQWARAECVREGDAFTYNGPALPPEHKFDPFVKDREKLPVIGVYAIAKTKGDDILTEVMPLSEIEKIRGKSQAFVKKNAGPWVDWFEQMCKKAVIKRASKTWPYTDDRLAQAIDVANHSEGGYDMMSDEEREAQHLLQHQAAVGRNFKTIAAIKSVFAALEASEIDPADAAYTIGEAWYELDQDEQRLLWRAPSKGGCFTTAEREFIKTDVPKAARREEAA